MSDWSSLSPPVFALVFEFLDRRTVANLSMTNKYAYAVSCQAKLREPNERRFYFYFSKTPEGLLPSATPISDRHNVAILQCYPEKHSASQICVYIVEDFSEEGLVIFEEKEFVIRLKRDDKENFIVMMSEATSCELLFATLFNFFKLHLTTKFLVFTFPSAAVVETLSTWIHEHGRKCQRVVFRRFEHMHAHVIDADYTQMTHEASTNCTEMVMKSVRLIKPNFVRIDLPTSFSPKHMKEISKFVDFFETTGKVRVGIEEKTLLRWSPSVFQVGEVHQPNGEHISVKAIAKWLADNKRVRYDYLRVNLPPGADARSVFLSALSSREEFEVVLRSNEQGELQLIVQRRDKMLAVLKFWDKRVSEVNDGVEFYFSEP